MIIAGWRAWYAGGTVYCSTETVWRWLPARGLQIVKVYYVEEWKPGRSYTKQLNGGDWYWMDEHGIIEKVPSVAWGHDGPKPDAPEHMVKQGTAVSEEHFMHLSDLADLARTLE